MESWYTSNFSGSKLVFISSNVVRGHHGDKNSIRITNGTTTMIRPGKPASPAEPIYTPARHSPKEPVWEGPALCDILPASPHWRNETLGGIQV
jgi:hypothetical protein